MRSLEDSRGAVLFFETSNFLFIEKKFAYISVLAIYFRIFGFKRDHNCPLLIWLETDPNPPQNVSPIKKRQFVNSKSAATFCGERE